MIHVMILYLFLLLKQENNKINKHTKILKRSFITEKSQSVDNLPKDQLLDYSTFILNIYLNFS